MKIQGKEELSKAVAEKVMGWSPHNRNTEIYVPAEEVDSPLVVIDFQFISDWKPASDANEAMKVWKKVNVVRVETTNLGRFMAKAITKNVESCYAVADTFQEAVCVVALKSVGIDVDYRDGLKEED